MPVAACAVEYGVETALRPGTEPSDRQRDSKRHRTDCEIRQPPADGRDQPRAQRLDQKTEQTRADERKTQREPFTHIKPIVHCASPGDRQGAGATDRGDRPGRIKKRQ